jgi:hypothetical protein
MTIGETNETGKRERLAKGGQLEFSVIRQANLNFKIKINPLTYANKIMTNH